jgi:hypothetical protein
MMQKERKFSELEMMELRRWWQAQVLATEQLWVLLAVDHESALVLFFFFSIKFFFFFLELRFFILLF